LDAWRFETINRIAPANRWELLDDGRLLLFLYDFDDMPDAGPSRPHVTFVSLGFDDLVAYTLGSYRGIEQTSVPRSNGQWVVTPDPEDTYFALSERSGHLYVGDSGGWSIDRFDPNGQLDLRIEFADVSNAPDDQRIAEGAARALAELEQRGVEGMEASVSEIADIEDSPTFRGLLSDDVGRLWVRWGNQPDPLRERYAIFGSGSI